MKLPFKKMASDSMEWLRRYKDGRRVTTAGRPATQYSILCVILRNTSLAPCARSLVISGWHTGEETIENYTLDNIILASLGRSQKIKVKI